MAKKETVVFGGGCFWCTEAAFRLVPGVISVIPGYAGGSKENPTYKEVVDGVTGHAEVVRVEYDPEKVTFRNLLGVFFTIHDPTTLNRQGNDTGNQYRSIVLFTSKKQQQEAEEYIRLHKENFLDPIVTEVVLLEKFYPAEEYHHNYYEKNPNSGYCQAVISPKIEKLKKEGGI